MDERVDLSTVITENTIASIENMAIIHGVTYQRMFDYLIASAIAETGKAAHPIQKIESPEEFDFRFRNTISDAVKKIELTDSKIMILKKAYYFFKMRNEESVITEKPHDKGRYKKYENAINLIDEMLSIANQYEKEKIISGLYQVYDRLILSRNDVKKIYTEKMNNELSKLKLTEYAQNNLIEIFKYCL